MRINLGRHLVLNATGASKMALLLALLYSLFACSTFSPPPPAVESSSAVYKEGVPGGALVNTVDMSAKVTAIDAANRKVTLLGPDGDEFTVKVGPEAVNFDQVRVGDLVNASVTEELIVYLNKESAPALDGGSLKALGFMEIDKGVPAPDGAAGMVALAQKGAQPGGLIAETVQVTATVTAIDQTNRTATLRFKDGSTKTFQVRDDIDLGQRKVGEKVVFQLTEMIAISVEKP